MGLLGPPAGGALVARPSVAVDESGPVGVGHVASAGRCYPGERLLLHTRLTLRQSQPQLTVRVGIPADLTLEAYQAPADRPNLAPAVEVDEQRRYVVWTLVDELAAGTRLEFEAAVRVAPVLEDQYLTSEATAADGDGARLASATTRIQVRAKGAYLRYLPELYERDELMGRLLMLFESFWAPIETQVDAIENYFEPMMTPTRLLPWLSTWVGMTLDERLSEERQRRLIRRAASLRRRRGTKAALREYLEIYSGGAVQIIEHRATNLILGPDSELGPGVALGLDNHPHMFTVTVRMPQGWPSDPSREERRLRRLLESIIDAEKPAHTAYALRITTPQEEGETS
jgi:phage tail-like protein